MRAKKKSGIRKKLGAKASKSGSKTLRLPWPSRVQVFEVGPRDGLQSEDKILDLKARVELVRLLAESGLKQIEVGSFVRADRIPQLQNTEAVVAELQRGPLPEGLELWAFVPNDIGLEQAVAAGIEGASFFIGASDTFCRKNVNRGRAEILADLPKLFKKARKNGLQTRIYLSTLVYCPYEGPVPAERVAELVDALIDAGAQEIALSDTTGDANPLSLRRVLEKLLRKHPPRRFALHLHDTRGLALANVLEGLGHGISKFDSSVGGMGGCPYAPGASGNLASEDLTNMLAGMGLLKDVDLGLLAKAGFFAESALGKALPSRVLRTLERKLKKNEARSA